jgi:hypothetical protein
VTTAGWMSRRKGRAGTLLSGPFASVGVVKLTADGNDLYLLLGTVFVDEEEQLLWHV